MVRKAAEKLKRTIETSLVLLFDALTLVGCFHLAIYLRTDVLPLLMSGFPEQPPTSDLTLIWWIFIPWAFFMFYEGLYTRRFAYWDEIRAFWLSAFFATVGVLVITTLGKMGGIVSRTVIVLMGGIAALALPFIRMSVKRIMRRAGLLRQRVLILGAGTTGRLIAKALRKEPNFGYEVVGFLDDDPDKVGTEIHGVKVHACVDCAARYIDRARIKTLIIAMPGAGRERFQGLISKYQHKVESVLWVPDIFGMSVLGTNLQHFFEEQAFALEFQNNLARPLNYFTKRTFDYVAGGLIFLVFTPPLIAIALIIRLTSKGPALYKHKRIGKDLKPFYCYKFRTMFRDSDVRLKEILDTDPEARAEWETYYKLKNDPRVTPVGKFLRRTSLDELPQLINIMRGEMSLVGPRPVVQAEIDNYYKDQASLCFCVTPGITGLWQVSGRSNTSYDYRVALDAWYVRNWNLWLDIVILLKTVKVVFRKEGAF